MLRPLLIGLLVTIVGCGKPAEQPELESAALTGGDHAGHAHGRVGVHGMVLFGSERLFLSHIPMFGTPHDVQLVLEGTVESGIPPEGRSFRDRTFTIKPEAFSLDDLASGALTSFVATVFDGNFEDGGRPLFRDVRFGVKHILLHAVLSNDKGGSSTLEYLALGTTTDRYLVHMIDGPTSFDHVVRLGGASPSALTAEELAAGVRIVVADHANAVAKRPRLHETLTVASSGGRQRAPMQVTVESEMSCLLGPDFAQPCGE